MQAWGAGSRTSKQCACLACSHARDSRATRKQLKRPRSRSAGNSELLNFKRASVPANAEAGKITCEPGHMEHGT